MDSTFSRKYPRTPHLIPLPIMKSLRLKRKKLTPILLQKLAIEKWDGRFPTVMGGQGALPFINRSPETLSTPAPAKTP